MANATFADINTAIYTILGTLEGEGQPLATVFAYPEADILGYPCAFPMFNGAKEVIVDNQYNSLAIEFVARFVFKDNNDKESYDLVLDTLQTALAEFRKDDHYTLGGLCYEFDVSPDIEILRSTLAKAPVVLFDLNVTAYLLQDTTL